MDITNIKEVIDNNGNVLKSLILDGVMDTIKESGRNFLGMPIDHSSMDEIERFIKSLLVDLFDLDQEDVFQNDGAHVVKAIKVVISRDSKDLNKLDVTPGNKFTRLLMLGVYVHPNVVHQVKQLILENDQSVIVTDDGLYLDVVDVTVDLEELSE